MDSPNLTLRIVLLGKTGTGKSASGNTILGNNAFLSKRSFRSVTTECSEKTCCIDEKNISVIDTPGIFSTDAHDGLIENACKQAMNDPVPCVFLVLIKVDRFTKEEKEAVEQIEEILGEDGISRSFILLTHGDSMDEMTADEIIAEDDEGHLHEVVSRFSGRSHVFNNKAEKPSQVTELLLRVDVLLKDVGKTFNLDSESPVEQLPLRNIVLLGKTGVGKSSSGNTILGLMRSDQFLCDSAFGSVTKECMVKSKVVEGKNVKLLDTPGLSDETISSRDLFKGISSSFVQMSEGVHAFVFVIKLGRLDSKDKKMIDMLKLLYDTDAMKYAMILFTHGDELRGNQSIEEKIQANDLAKSLIESCQGRYCVFNNKATNHKQQVRKFFEVVDGVVGDNNGTPYVTKMIRIAHTILLQEKARAVYNYMVAALQRFWNFIKMVWKEIQLSFSKRHKDVKYLTPCI